ncbi:MAG: protein-methionine-sulfoxide reductase catalytic subunit MsrP [Gammaproteobacteria bacterium]|nr:protein-methionine-sulfoxide reductase catalytic subunit MsrP [Gammaproteobacteria bacterium]
MLIRIPRKNDPKSSEITPANVYHSRRKILMSTGALASAAALPTTALPSDWIEERGYKPHEPAPLLDITPKPYTTQYNNFYEFGTDKEDPARYAEAMTIEPWSVEISGLVAKPGTYALEDVLAGIDLEERIYRLRCVEAWSAVIPWVGFPVSKLLAKYEPLEAAKYVKFTTHLNRDEMRGTRSFFSSIDFPYIEGLRLDEASNDLAIFAVGMYGDELLNQNGAPLRLVVPWKYGFKSIKSIVKIELTKRQPPTTWNMSAPQEYGFYSNVNPEVDHPRWSQAQERVLGAGLFARNQPTLMFNGYAEDVAGMYDGMNLRRNY